MNKDRQRTLRQRSLRVLGLKEGADRDEIKLAFKRLAVKYHPDKHENLPEAERHQAEEVMKELTEAVRFLTSESAEPEQEPSSDFLSTLRTVGPDGPGQRPYEVRMRDAQETKPPQPPGFSPRQAKKERLKHMTPQERMIELELNDASIRAKPYLLELHALMKKGRLVPRQGPFLPLAKEISALKESDRKKSAAIKFLHARRPMTIEEVMPLVSGLCSAGARDADGKFERIVEGLKSLDAPTLEGLMHGYSSLAKLDERTLGRVVAYLGKLSSLMGNNKIRLKGRDGVIACAVELSRVDAEEPKKARALDIFHTRRAVASDLIAPIVKSACDAGKEDSEQRFGRVISAMESLDAFSWEPGQIYPVLARLGDKPLGRFPSIVSYLRTAKVSITTTDELEKVVGMVLAHDPDPFLLARRSARAYLNSEDPLGSFIEAVPRILLATQTKDGERALEMAEKLAHPLSGASGIWEAHAMLSKRSAAELSVLKELMGAPCMQALSGYFAGMERYGAAERMHDEVILGMGVGKKALGMFLAVAGRFSENGTPAEIASAATGFFGRIKEAGIEPEKAATILAKRSLGIYLDSAEPLASFAYAAPRVVCAAATKEGEKALAAIERLAEFSESGSGIWEVHARLLARKEDDVAGIDALISAVRAMPQFKGSSIVENYGFAERMHDQVAVGMGVGTKALVRFLASAGKFSKNSAPDEYIGAATGFFGRIKEAGIEPEKAATILAKRSLGTYMDQGESLASFAHVAPRVVCAAATKEGEKALAAIERLAEFSESGSGIWEVHARLLTRGEKEIAQLSALISAVRARPQFTGRPMAENLGAIERMHDEVAVGLGLGTRPLVTFLAYSGEDSVKGGTPAEAADSVRDHFGKGRKAPATPQKAAAGGGKEAGAKAGGISAGKPAAAKPEAGAVMRPADLARRAEAIAKKMLEHSQDNTGIGKVRERLFARSSKDLSALNELITKFNWQTPFRGKPAQEKYDAIEGMYDEIAVGMGMGTPALMKLFIVLEKFADGGTPAEVLDMARLFFRRAKGAGADPVEAAALFRSFVTLKTIEEGRGWTDDMKEAYYLLKKKSKGEFSRSMALIINGFFSAGGP